MDGDDFAWAITNCWSQDDGELLDGTVTLEDYTESVDFNTGVLFNIGFGGLGAEDPGPKACTRLSPAQSDGALVATVAAWSAIEVIVRAFEQWPSWG